MPAKLFQRNSIFNREKSRGNKSMQAECKFMSESLLETANRPLLHIQHKPPKPQAANYEFKFDEIESAVIAK